MKTDQSIQNMSQFDVKKSCLYYSDSIQKTLLDLFNVDLKKTNKEEVVSKLEDKEDLFFSILFTGQIYGEFIFGLNKKTALNLLSYQYQQGDEESVYWKNREDILDSFKEVLNIAAGMTIRQFKEVFPELTITPPKAVEGQLSLSSYKIEKTQLLHNSGTLSCYIYIDLMKLQIRETLDENQKQIKEEKLKQEELKRLNKAKSEFLANMSHELRTPLNGMIGMLDILKRSHMNQVQIEQFDVIYKSGEFLLSLISDILEFSKIESGKLEVEKRPFNLRQSIENVIENLANIIYARDLDFNTYIAPEISGLYIGDETRLKQILMNLVGNAVKFTPTGYVSIRAELSKEKADRLKIIVADTGIGIPADKLSSIFDSFSQADVSDNRKYGGTGLGLSISKSIIQALGGNITVISQEAKGSEFIIDLPLVKLSDIKASLESIDLKNKKIFSLIQNIHLFESVENYIKFFNRDCLVEKIEVNQNLNLEVNSIIIIEFKFWKNLDKENMNLLISQAKLKNCYLLFLTLPKETEYINELYLNSKIENMFFSNSPISLNKLYKIIKELPTLNEQTNKQNSKATIPTASIDSMKKILVVEDNKMNQIVIKTMLNQLGYQIEIAENGQQALDFIQNGKHYDLIFMDCQMPIMNGYEATKAIREMEEINKLSKTTIIALTANAFRETKESCFECGMDDFATKPIKFDTLKSIIHKRFKKAG